MKPWFVQQKDSTNRLLQLVLLIFISVINQLDKQTFCFTTSLFASSLNLCTRRPPTGVMIPEAV